MSLCILPILVCVCVSVSVHVISMNRLSRREMQPRRTRQERNLIKRVDSNQKGGVDDGTSPLPLSIPAISESGGSLPAAGPATLGLPTLSPFEAGDVVPGD